MHVGRVARDLESIGEHACTAGVSAVSDAFPCNMAHHGTTPPVCSESVASTDSVSLLRRLLCVNQAQMMQDAFLPFDQLFPVGEELRCEVEEISIDPEFRFDSANSMTLPAQPFAFLRPGQEPFRGRVLRCAPAGLVVCRFGSRPFLDVDFFHARYSPCIGFSCRRTPEPLGEQFPIEYQEPARLEPEPPQHRFSAGAGRMRRTGSLLLSDMCSRFWPDEPRTLLKLRVSSSILGF